MERFFYKIVVVSFSIGFQNGMPVWQKLTFAMPFFVLNRDEQKGNYAKTTLGICDGFGQILSRTGWLKIAEFDVELLSQFFFLRKSAAINKAQKMECVQPIHLQSMGKIQKLGAQVPHLLSENNEDQRCT